MLFRSPVLASRLRAAGEGGAGGRPGKGGAGGRPGKGGMGDRERRENGRERRGDREGGGDKIRFCFFYFAPFLFQ